MTQAMTIPVITDEEFSSIATGQAASRKVLSSTVLSEERLNEPEAECRYVEVPVVEEVVRTVPKKSVVEVEKIVPRVEIDYIEKTIEVPRIEYIDRHVEKEHIQEVIHEIPGEVEYRDIPRTVVRKQPRVYTVTSEKVVEVPGPTINVSVNPVEMMPIKQYHDVEVPVVVAQTIRPMVTQSEEYADVEVLVYEPEIQHVDVYIATPIASKFVTVGAGQHVHNCVSIPPAQYNTILRSLNQHIPPEYADQIPFIKTNKKVEFLALEESPGYISLDPAFLHQNNQDYNPELQRNASQDPGYGDSQTHTEFITDSDQFTTPGTGSLLASRGGPSAVNDKKKRFFGC